MENTRKETNTKNMEWVKKDTETHRKRQTKDGTLKRKRITGTRVSTNNSKSNCKIVRNKIESFHTGEEEGEEERKA